MKTTFFKMAIVALAGTVANAAPIRRVTRQAAGAAFFITNDESGNFIIANEIGVNGKLTAAAAIPAGGRGLHGNSTGPDGLFSQGAIKVAGQNLYTVNAGSNTISMFKINVEQPLQLTQVGNPVSSQGEFPISLSVSSTTGNVCVLNGGQLNSVACFTPDDTLGLLPVSNSFRQLGLDQTTPATGPAGTASHILFNAAGTRLAISVKGTGADAPGFVAIFDVAEDGSLSDSFQAVTPPSGGALPFGMANHPTNPSALVVTDPGVGFDVLDIDATIGTSNNSSDSNRNTTSIPSLASSNTIAGGSSFANKVANQTAVCWTAFSKKTGGFYLSDIGTNMITEVMVNSTTLESIIIKQYPFGDGIATIDEEAGTINGQDFLYVLAANNTSIEVLALPALGHGERIQSFSLFDGLQAAGIAFKPENLQGMALYIPDE